MRQVFYVPERGDIVWISRSPDGGPPRTGRRPALVLSPRSFNSRIGIALLCPVTARVGGYPFEVVIPHGHPVEGAILADRAESIDWRAARAERICSLPDAVIEEALGKFRALIG